MFVLLLGHCQSRLSNIKEPLVARSVGAVEVHDGSIDELKAHVFYYGLTL